jgi:similar to stage IV sporulation protein
MIQVLRLLKGYVSFTAEGGFPERFINLCNSNEILLWDVKNDGVKVKACTTSADFKRVKIPAENSGMEIKDVSEKGLKSFINRYKYRCGLCFGAFIAVFIITFLSGSIWEVEILSKDGVNVETFTESLAESGVKKGARKSKIDILKVQEEMMLKHSDLLWISVNIFGSKAQVEITTVTHKKEEADIKTPTNVVAKKDGVVTLVKGYYGVNVVKEGESVANGTLLISGVGKYADGSEYFTHAKGEVYAKTENENTETTNRRFKAFITNQNKSIYGLEIFSFKIPFGKTDNKTEKAESYSYLKSGETFLPLAIYRVDTYFVKDTNVALTENQCMLYSLLKLVEKKRENYTEADIYEEKYSFEKTDEVFMLKQNLNCIENIATEQPIMVEN